MKKITIALLLLFVSVTSFSNAKSLNLVRTSVSLNQTGILTNCFYVYEFFLMNDGCYHLYKLSSYIDYGGMAVQGWVLVDPQGYTGTTSICYGSGE